MFLSEWRLHDEKVGHALRRNTNRECWVCFGTCSQYPWFASWDLAEEYGVDDADGARPHFVRWLKENMPEVAAGWRKADDGFYAYWGKMPYRTPE